MVQYLALALPATVWEQPSSLRDLMGVMPICASRARFVDLNLHYGNGNKLRFQPVVPSPFGHIPGPVLLTQRPIKWPGSNSPRTWQVTHLPTHLVIGLLSEDPNVDPKVDPCFSATLLNKVLDAVPSTQGPKKIYVHWAPHNKPANQGLCCRFSNSLVTCSNQA